MRRQPHVAQKAPHGKDDDYDDDDYDDDDYDNDDSDEDAWWW